MATTSLTRSQQAARSTVAMKALMAVSGLIMIGYLLAHMYGNLKVFAGEAAFDDYAHHLRTLGEPLLPYSGALWILRIVLLASVLAHMYSAVTLWRPGAEGPRRDAALPQQQGRAGVQRTYASFTLRWGGIVIAAVRRLPPAAPDLERRRPGRAAPAARTSGWSTASRSGGWCWSTRSPCSRSASTSGTASGAR